MPAGTTIVVAINHTSETRTVPMVLAKGVAFRRVFIGSATPGAAGALDLAVAPWSAAVLELGPAG